MKKILFILLLSFIMFSCEENTPVCVSNVSIINEKYDEVVIHVFFYDGDDLVLAATYEKVIKNQTLDFLELHNVVDCRVKVFRTINSETLVDSYLLKVIPCEDNILYIN